MRDETVSLSTARTMKISNVLRWLKTEDAPILQQAWVCIETGEIEWEDVPTEGE